MSFPRTLIVAVLCLLVTAPVVAQDAPPATAPQPAPSAVETQSANPAPATPPAPAAAVVPDAPQSQAATQPQHKTAQEILAEEKSQRMLGVVPMYGVTNYQYAPALTKSQKFDLMISSYGTPFPYLAAGFQAGLSQATNTFVGYGQGASGYGKRFGSALADGFDSSLFSNFVYPTIFKQDPRYFRLGEGPMKQRIWYAMKWEFLTKKDSDRSTTFSYSNVLGALTAGGISNAYYPQEERGFGLTMSRTAVSFGWGMVGNFVLEFWPDISKGLLKKHKQDDVTIK